MKQMLNLVRDFQEKFEQTINTKPTLLNEEEYTLRYKLMQEENKEYFAASEDQDIIETLDAFADQLYILLGSINAHGLQDKIIPAFQLVHENNMRKLGPDGKVLKNADGKVIKPEGFVKVELNTLFTEDERVGAQL